jgi:hypothetical protein
VPELQPVGEDFFATAPTRFRRTWRVRRPAASVWEELTADGTMGWCTGLSSRWTSARPFGVGTTREVTVLGALKVQERYFVWEEGARKAFYGTSMNLPLFSRLAEDYRVEPDGPDACSFTWIVAIEPSAVGRPGAPVNRLLFDRFYADTGKHFGAS